MTVQIDLPLRKKHGPDSVIKIQAGKAHHLCYF